MRDIYARKSLRESLEEYADRTHQTQAEARHRWRLEGLKRLFPGDPVWGLSPSCHANLVSRGGLCRIAPDVSVPTAHVDVIPDADMVTS